VRAGEANLFAWARIFLPEQATFAVIAYLQSNN